MPIRCSVLLAILFAAAGGAQERPNILFAISDDQSWMHAGAYGDPTIQTPAFDRIAKEGVLFQYAYSAAPSCAPSRSAILTGKHIYEVEEAGTLFGTLRSKYAVFTLLLEDAGYEVAATGKTWGPGELEGFTRPVFGKKFTSRRLAERPPGINPLDYAANFEDFYAQRDKTKPFFFWFGATEPHQSYDIGAWKRNGKRLEDAQLPGPLPDHPVTRGEILDYGLEIEHFDRHLARILQVLEETGDLDNTLVLVTSDHGNPLPRSKCNLYDSGSRVPLAARWPGKIPPGREVTDFVNLMDIAPTLLEVAGVKPPSGMSARSFLPTLRSSESGLVDEERDFVITAFERHTIARRNGEGYPMRSIRTHRYSYIRNYEPDRWPAGDPDYASSHQGFYGDIDRGESKRIMMELAYNPAVRPYFLRSFGRRPAEELYDMGKDPHQLHNLAEDPRYAAAKRELKERLERYLTRNGDPRMRGETPWDHYEFTGRSIYDNPKWRTEGRPTPFP